MENKIGFEKCLADECLLKRRIEKGSIVVCVYIDDTLCVGKKEAINEFIQVISYHFTVKEKGEMKKHVGSKVEKQEKQVSLYTKMI